MLTFVALDFETASFARDSACEIGLVRVEDGRVTAEETRFIRPPSRQLSARQAASATAPAATASTGGAEQTSTFSSHPSDLFSRP